MYQYCWFGYWLLELIHCLIIFHSLTLWRSHHCQCRATTWLYQRLIFVVVSSNNFALTWTSKVSVFNLLYQEDVLWCEIIYCALIVVVDFSVIFLSLFQLWWRIWYSKTSTGISYKPKHLLLICTTIQDLELYFGMSHLVWQASVCHIAGKKQNKNIASSLSLSLSLSLSYFFKKGRMLGSPPSESAPALCLTSLCSCLFCLWQSLSLYQGTEVKAITYSNMQIYDKEGQHEVFVIIDI